MILVPARFEHFAEVMLARQAAQKNDGLLDMPKGPSWAALSNRKAVACGGLYPVNLYRSHAWMVFSELSRAEFLFVHRAVTRYLENATGRVEFAVRKDFAQGHRWAKMLGFEVEAPLMRRYCADGADAVLYAKVFS